MSYHIPKSIYTYISFVYFFVAFTSFFPWTKLGFLDLDSDTQIYPLLFLLTGLIIGVFISKFLNIKIINIASVDSRVKNFTVLILTASFLSIVSLFVIDDFNGGSIRALVPYLILAINFVFYIFIVDIRYSPAIQKACISAGLIWLLVSIIQYFYNKEFLTWTVNRTVLTDDRGVIGLGSEPGYNATVLLVFFIVLYILNKKTMAFFLLILIAFLTKHAVSVFITPFLLLSMYLAGKNINFKLFIKLIFCIVIAALLFYFLFVGLQYYNPDSRIVRLIRVITESGIGTILSDGSLNTRLTHYVASIHGFFFNIFLPNGSNSWPAYVSEYSSRSLLFWNSGLHETDRINSGLGALLYESGIFGAVIIYYLYKLILFRTRGIFYNVFIFLVFCLFLLTLISIKQMFLYPLLFIYIMFSIKNSYLKCNRRDTILTSSDFMKKCSQSKG